MPSTRSFIVFSLLSATLTHAMPSMTYVGCFSSSKGLTEQSTFQYQSSGHCQEACVGANNQAVLGLTGGNDCWCGSQTPPTSAKVSDSSCNTPCTGYGDDDCGGTNFWSVYLTGTEANVGSAGGSGSAASSADSSAQSTPATTTPQATSSPAATSQSPTVVTTIQPGKTIVVTESAQAESTNSPSASPSAKASGPNVAGIAAGVVVGVVVLLALVGGLFFFVRHRRRKQAQQGYKNSQVQDFMAGGKSTIPATRRGPEQRIDTEAMAQRRMSDGSIADNEDYSRKILKVTNPDNS